MAASYGFVAEAESEPLAMLNPPPVPLLVCQDATGPLNKIIGAVPVGVAPVAPRSTGFPVPSINLRRWEGLLKSKNSVVLK